MKKSYLHPYCWFSTRTHYEVIAANTSVITDVPDEWDLDNRDPDEGFN